MGRDGSTHKHKRFVEDYFVSGKNFGGTDDECYLAFFPHNDGDQSLWFLGSYYMQDSYYIFDMTPSESGNNFLNIGIAPKNVVNPVMTAEAPNLDKYGNQVDTNAEKMSSETEADREANKAVIITAIVGAVVILIFIVLLIGISIANRNKESKRIGRWGTDNVSEASMYITDTERRVIM